MARPSTGTKSATAKPLKGMPLGEKTKQPQPVDCHVGSRVRMQRILSGLSQEKLGDALGITFQQIQKYEKGTKRIGASRLHHIAQVLEVPVAFFYDGMASPDGANPTTTVPGAAVTSFLATSE